MLSTEFPVSNGVKQRAVITPLLFSAYVDALFKQLKHHGIGCYVYTCTCRSCNYVDAFEHTYNAALVALSLYNLRCMIATCEKFAKKKQITFNPT